MKIYFLNIISIILYVLHYNNGITSKLILIKSEQRNKHFAPATTDCNQIYSDRKKVLYIQKKCIVGEDQGLICHFNSS